MWNLGFINETHGGELTEAQVDVRFAVIAAADTLGNLACFYPAVYVLDTYGRKCTVVLLKNLTIILAACIQFSARYAQIFENN